MVRATGCALLLVVSLALAAPAGAQDSTGIGKQHAVENGRHVQPTQEEVRERLARKRQQQRMPRADSSQGLRPEIPTTGQRSN